MRIRTLGIVALLSAISGCTTTETKNLEKPAQPITYEQAMAKCTPIAKAWDNRFKQELATYMKVPIAEMPTVYCDRVLRGIASGRIKREDFVNADRGSASQLFAAIKGR